MHVLFVHQNCPAQFRHIAPALAARGWQCTFATTNAKDSPGDGVRKVVYRPSGLSKAHHALAGLFHRERAHEQGVYEALRAEPDLRPPDLIVAHSGFGSSLFLPHVYDAPIINFFEYYFRSAILGQQLGYRPDVLVGEANLLGIRVRNACFLLDLDNCDRGWCPNRCQRDTLPKEYHDKVEVIPEGIDADFWKPGTRGDGRRVLPDGTVVPAGTRIVTYTARGLEMMRGFDLFMQVAKRIYQRFPNVLFVVVGEERSYYNDDRRITGGKTFREHVLAQDEYDLSKFRFTGRVPEGQLAAILGTSDLHVYLTQPFVTSWSLLDAMSSGCVVLASDQTCVREYVKDGVNGLLADFFDVEGLAERAIEVLSDLPKHRHLGEAARRTIDEGGYALRDTLPRIEEFFRRVAALGPRTPSVRSELLVRPGTAATAVHGTVAHPHPPAAAEPLRPAGRSTSVGVFDGEIPWRAAGRDERQVTREARSLDATSAPSEPADVSRITPLSSRPPSPGVVLFCWELGSGLGHLAQIRALAKDLVAGGHRVFVAASQLDVAEAVLAGTGVVYLPAPLPLQKPRDRRPFKATLSTAHVLANMGWAWEPELAANAGAWRNLFRLTKPDLIVFDHAPAALLASRGGMPWRRAVIGTGFCCPPPDADPLPAFRRGSVKADQLREDERRLLSVANRVSARYGWPKLDRLADLYAEVDETFLITVPELDHFRERRNANASYWGPVYGTSILDSGADFPPCATTQTHNGDGLLRSVFAYLSRCPALPDVLEALRDSGHSVLAYVRGADARLRKRFTAGNVRIADQPMDLSRVLRRCDAAVLQGGHGTTAQALLAGRPVMLLPQYLEQTLTAERVTALGVGEAILPADIRSGGGELRTRLRAFLTGGRLDACADAARALARKYQAFDVERQRQAILARALELLGQRHRPVSKAVVAGARARPLAAAGV